MSALGPRFDDQIINVLRHGPRTAPSLARAIKVDSGALAARLAEPLSDEVVVITDAAGSNPVWGLTDEGRRRRHPS